MQNSSAICQRYVALALSGVRRQFPDAHFYHYMDDILVAASTQDELLRIQPQLPDALHSHGLQVAPEKVQQQPPWKYLGVKILERTIQHQEVRFVHSVKTLNDAQKLDTQIVKFGWLKYVHVSIDTFSSAMWASAHTGENTHNVIAHWRQAFAILGIPSTVKTDNGPAYTSQKASDEAHQPRAKVRVRNLTTKQWEGPFELIALGHGYACVSTDTGVRWVPVKCVHLDLQPQRQNRADRHPENRHQNESHQAEESLSDDSDADDASIPSTVKTDNGPAYTSQKASDEAHQPRAKVRVRNLTTKQWEGPFELIALGHGVFEDNWRQMAEKAAADNMQLPQNDPRYAVEVDALMGKSIFLNPDAQAAWDPRVLEQGQEIGIGALLKTIEMPAPKPRYMKITQGLKELFLPFVERIAAALEKQVEDDTLRQILCKQLAKDNANDNCRKIIESLPGDPTLTDMVQACSKVGSVDYKMSALAAVLQPAQKCCGCGQQRHVKCKQKQSCVPRTAQRSRGDGGFRSTGVSQVLWTACISNQRPQMTCTLILPDASPSQIQLQDLIDTEFFSAPSRGPDSGWDTRRLPTDGTSPYIYTDNYV
ncbi:hypothetical protein HGM15179_015769 [Zosterops borbonicus]|uniref:ribonuclease H n=1 Tax=Zosterops borbonicus TaxID=364589 RepID=A0A8K1G3U8_9PASS|nr:hypothetical protein HGM15179_015769 [Zosterops borbonicus]